MSVAPTLNTRYFTLVHERTVGEHVYQVYSTRSPSSTLVLYSSTHEPLAAFTFVSARDAATSLVTAYGAENRFAALTRVDNAEYALVLTNLTDVRRANAGSDPRLHGMLKIDVLTEDVAVRDVDVPTLGINQWNELHPSQSALIEGDQRAGNRVLELRGATTATGAAVTVAQDAVASTRVGTRLYVNVTAPRDFPELVTKLVGSTWRPAEMFVRRVKGHLIRATSNSSLEERRPYAASVSSASSGSAMPALESSSQSFSFGALRVNHESYVMPQSQAFTFGTRSTSVNSISKGEMLFSGGSSLSMQSRPLVDVPSTSTIDTAQAATSSVGARRVDVVTTDTGVVYDYDACGARAVVTLAVHRQLAAYDCMTVAEQRTMALTLVDEASQRDVDAEMATMPRFVSESCVVCLDAPPTYVIVRCGHQCLCSACCVVARASATHTCMLCRARRRLRGRGDAGAPHDVINEHQRHVDTSRVSRVSRRAHSARDDCRLRTRSVWHLYYHIASSRRYPSHVSSVSRQHRRDYRERRSACSVAHRRRRRACGARRCIHRLLRAVEAGACKEGSSRRRQSSGS